MDGHIVRISGPDSLEVGKTVPILIEVIAPDSLCVKRAEGFIMGTGHNYLQIGARIIYTGKNANGCDCLETPHAHTVIYFTPEVAGRYVFGTRKPAGVPITSADSLEHKIFVN